MRSQCNARYFLIRDKCPICMSNRWDVLYSCPLARFPVRGFIESHYSHQGHIDWERLEGTDYVICECSECGLLYQKHVPNGDFLNTLYNEMIGPTFLARLESTRLTVDNFEEIAGELSLLIRAIGKHPTEIRFLDYGMGYGRWARIAAAIGAQVFCTEISPDKIAAARKLGIEPIQDESLSEMRFDIIHTEQVFEHLTDPRSSFQKLASALSRNGIMKIAVPSPGRIRRLLKTHGMIDRSPQEGTFHATSGCNLDRFQDYVSIMPLEHLNAYSSRTIVVLAGINGMRLVGRVRRQSVAVCTANVSLLMRSLYRLIKVSLRPVLRRNSGYYLLTSSTG